MAVADGNRHREAEHAPIERQVEVDAVVRGGELPDEHLAAPVSEDQAEDRARRRQAGSLGEQLTGEPQPRGAEREPDAQLVTPRDRARQQQVGDIRAGDEQDQADDDQNRRERLLVLASERGLTGGGRART